MHDIDALTIMHDARRRAITPAEHAIIGNVIDCLIGVWGVPLYRASVPGLVLIRQHCERTLIWQAALGVSDNE